MTAPEQAVDHATPLNRRTLADHLGPTLKVLVFLDLQEFGGVSVEPSFCKAAVPRPDCDIRNRVFISGDVFVIGQTLVEHHRAAAWSP